MVTRRWWVAAAALALAGCSGDFGAPEPATSQGESVLDLWRALLFAATALGLLVVVLAAVAVVRYRAGRNADDGDGDEPPQRHGNALVEGIYVAVPLLVVAGFFAYTLRIDDIVNGTHGDPDVVLDVTGYRWGWRFEYPDDGVVVESIAGEVPEIALPVGATVRVHLESDDVIHSFYVPEFLTKQDLIPGLREQLDVDLTRTGRFVGHCAEFCGLDHARMNFAVSIVDPDDYEAWLDDHREAP